MPVLVLLFVFLPRSVCVFLLVVLFPSVSVFVEVCVPVDLWQLAFVGGRNAVRGHSHLAHAGQASPVASVKIFPGNPRWVWVSSTEVLTIVAGLPTAARSR